MTQTSNPAGDGLRELRNAGSSTVQISAAMVTRPADDWLSPVVPTTASVTLVAERQEHGCGGTADTPETSNRGTNDGTPPLGGNPLRRVSDRAGSGLDAHLAEPGTAATVDAGVVARGPTAEQVGAWAAESHPIATAADVLCSAAEVVRARGIAGEGRVVKLVYLATTSRLLDRPANLAPTGPLSVGKRCPARVAHRLEMKMGLR
jgi:hypothetical protein